MKLLNELISLRRISKDDAEGAAEEDAIRRREDSRYSHDDDLTPRREYGVGFVDDEPDTASEDSEVSDTEGLDDISDDMGRLDDKQGGDDEDVSPDNPHEQGTPEHDAWIAGYEAGMNHDEHGEQDVEADSEEFPDDVEPDVEQDADVEIVDNEVGEEPPVDELPGDEPPVEDEEENPYSQGWQAQRAGKNYSNNPYPQWAAEHKDWREGLLDAEEDEKIEQNERDAVEDEGVNKKSFLGQVVRGWEADKKAQASWTKASRSEKAGDEAGANKHFKNSIRYSHLLRTDKGAYVGNENEESAIDQGYAACYKGKGREANPYPRGTEEYNDWLEAWNDGMNELSQGNASGRTGPDREEDCEIGKMIPRVYSDEEDADFYTDKNWRERYGRDDVEEQCPHCQHPINPKAGQYCPKCGHQVSGSEDEGENEWGGGAYDQQGAHMGGAKDTTVGEEDPNAEAGEDVDLNAALGDNEGGDETDPKLDALTDKTTEDPDRQGLVRKVKGAHLVYKRQIEDGTYEELWIYNSGNLRDELDVRKAVLAGTDIPTTKTTSPDGAQKYELWSAGNAEMLQIKGLPN